MKSAYRKLTNNHELFFTLVAMLALLFFMLVVYFNTNVMMEKRYQKALVMLEQENWHGAIQALRSVPNHKDVEILKRYAKARDQLEFQTRQELGDAGYFPVLVHLYQIPENYQGEYKESIDQLKKEVLAKRDKYANEHDHEIRYLDYDYSMEDKVVAVRVGKNYMYYESHLFTPVFETIY